MMINVFFVIVVKEKFYQGKKDATICKLDVRENLVN